MDDLAALVRRILYFRSMLRDPFCELLHFYWSFVGSTIRATTASNTTPSDHLWYDTTPSNWSVSTGNSSIYAHTHASCITTNYVAIPTPSPITSNSTIRLFTGPNSDLYNSAEYSLCKQPRSFCFPASFTSNIGKFEQYVFNGVSYSLSDSILHDDLFWFNSAHQLSNFDAASWYTTRDFTRPSFITFLCIFFFEFCFPK